MEKTQKIMEKSVFKHLMAKLEIEVQSNSERFIEWRKKMGADISNSNEMCKAINKIIEWN
jgi:hypothetical protein